MFPERESERVVYLTKHMMLLSTCMIRKYKYANTSTLSLYNILYVMIYR